MKLWDKDQFKVDKAIEKFTIGDDRHYDGILVQYDIRASIAHAKMLTSKGLITQTECSRLLNVLEGMLIKAQNGEFVIGDTFEDMHSLIEHILVENLGDIGKKIHMARSRNDQVLVAVQLYLKDRLQAIKTMVKTLFDTLISLADTHKNIALPGYTHLQVAMPSSFGLWFSAYAESLIDDMYFINAALRVTDQNPLGSAAGYGSSFPIDRTITTRLLGFSELKYNVVSAQMLRGKTERYAATAIGGVAATMSKMAMDICLYMSQNFNFITFPDTLTTGSSIMPHKKNPDVFELIRAKCNKIQGVPNTFALLTTNLPGGYHRDLQLCKEIIMPAVEDIQSCLEIMDFSISKVEVRRDILDNSIYDHIYSVDTLNDVVMRDNTPFRDAYKQIANAIEKGNYVPKKDGIHTHEGSKDHLCLEAIKAKMIRAFDTVNS